MDEKKVKISKELEDDCLKNHFWFYYFMLLIVGLGNNIGYHLANISAQHIAKQSDHPNLVGSFLFSLLILGIVMRILNSAWLLKYRHLPRIFVNFLFLLIGFALLIFGTYYCENSEYSKKIRNFFFYTSLVGCVFYGIASSFGDSTILGYLKCLPPDILVGYTSGTGISGLVGAIVTIVIGETFQDYIVFSACSFIPFAYFVCFYLVDRRKNQILERPSLTGDILNNDIMKRDTKIQILNSSRDDLPLTNIEESKNNVGLCTNFSPVWNKVWTDIICLTFVYYFEYTNNVSCADRISQKWSLHSPDVEFLQKLLYQLMLLSYYIGVFISRASLKLVKIQKVYVLFALQLINLLINMSLVIAEFEFDIFLPEHPYVYAVIFIFYFYTGMVAGLAMVNCYYLALNQRGCTYNEKELAINIMTMFTDCAILAASITSMILSNFVFVIHDKI